MMIKKIIVLTCIVWLSACTTIKTNSEREAEQERAIKTAKINSELGIAYLERKNLKRAKQKLLLALEQAPKAPEPWYSMAYYLEVTGNKSQARNDYLKAIEVAPNRGDTHNNYGTFLCRQGEYQAAIQQFLIAIKDPNYLDPAGVYENAGICARLIPQNTLALYYFNRALTQDPGRVLSLINIIEIYIKMGDLKQAQAKLALLKMMSPANLEVKRLHLEIEKKITAQKVAISQVRVYAADLDNARSFKEVVAFAKQHKIPFSKDPLLPYPPNHNKEKVSPSLVIKKLKIISTSKKKMLAEKQLPQTRIVYDVTGKKIVLNTTPKKVSNKPQKKVKKVALINSKNKKHQNL